MKIISETNAVADGVVCAIAHMVAMAVPSAGGEVVAV